MSKAFQDPTPEEQERCARVQAAIIAEMNLAAREGASLAELLAGAAGAVATLILSAGDPSKVRKWFELQADLARDLEQRH